MKSISIRECGSMSFDRLRTNGGRMIPFVLSLSKDPHPRPVRPEIAAGPAHNPPFALSPPTQDPFVLSLSKDAPPSPPFVLSPPTQEPFVLSPPTQEPFVLSLSKDADQSALNGNPRHHARFENRHAPAAG